MKIFSTFLLVTSLAATAFAQTQASFVYKIYHTASGKEIQLPELVEDLSKSDIVIFGEQHDDSIAHLLQHKVLQGLYSQRPQEIILSMEMWQRDVQPIMDEYLAGWISEKNFKTESRAWNNYSDYKPLIDFAKEQKIPVLCANTPARYTNMVTRGTLNALNQLPKSTIQNYLPSLPIDTLTGSYYDKFLIAMGGHVTPGMYIYQSQNLWDATMAQSIAGQRKAHSKKLVYHLNGRFHSDEYLGVTYRLKNTRPKDKIKTISAIEENEYQATAHKQLADYVIITGVKKKKEKE